MCTKDGTRKFPHPLPLKTPSIAHTSRIHSTTNRCPSLPQYPLLYFKRLANNIFREWFTFCFIPIIPFSLKPYKEVGCHICNFWQDIKYRPDVQQQMQGGGQPAVMMHGGNGHAPPSGVPQYK